MLEEEEILLEDRRKKRRKSEPQMGEVKASLKFTFKAKRASPYSKIELPKFLLCSVERKIENYRHPSDEHVLFVQFIFIARDNLLIM